jgi:hypothetical protein
MDWPAGRANGQHPYLFHRDTLKRDQRDPKGNIGMASGLVRVLERSLYDI